tara:strand:- start:9281 stop:9802 length:522 start_codon:yes stop_codon:yes gene_type:complete
MSPKQLEKKRKIAEALEKNMPSDVLAQEAVDEKETTIALKEVELDTRLAKVQENDRDIIADTEDDVEFARANIRNTIMKGNESLDRLAELADSLEHPRAFEVYANMLKTMSSLNHDLIDLQKKRKDIRKTESAPTRVDIPSGGGSGPVNVFVGTTADLQKQIEGEVIDAETSE